MATKSLEPFWSTKLEQVDEICMCQNRLPVEFFGTLARRLAGAIALLHPHFLITVNARDGELGSLSEFRIFMSQHRKRNLLPSIYSNY